MNDLEDLILRVSAALSAVRLEVDTSCLCPRDNSDLDRVLIMLLSKLIRLGDAVCQLVRNEFYGEGFGMARSCAEAFLLVKYISNKDSESRATSYLNFAKAHFYNLDQLRQRYFAALERHESIRQKWITEAEQFANKRHWVPAFNMAMEIYEDPKEVSPTTGKGFQAEFDWYGIYEHTSHYVHVHALSLAPHATLGGEMYKISTRDNEPEKGCLALIYALSYVYMTFIIVDRHWGREPSKEVHRVLGSVLDELRKSLPQDRILWAKLRNQTI